MAIFVTGLSSLPSFCLFLDFFRASSKQNHFVFEDHFHEPCPRIRELFAKCAVDPVSISTSVRIIGPSFTLIGVVIIGNLMEGTKCDCYY